MKKVYYNTTRLNIIGKSLAELGLELDKLSNKEKKLVFEKAKSIDKDIIFKIYNNLKENIEK